MLTKNEKEWLENRGKFSCWYCPNIPQAMCIMGERPAHCAIIDTDWKDTAEFEARIAAKLAKVIANLVKENPWPDIEAQATTPDLILKWAYLKVEEEMDGQSKDSSRNNTF